MLSSRPPADLAAHCTGVWLVAHRQPVQANFQALRQQLSGPAGRIPQSAAAAAAAAAAGSNSLCPFWLKSTPPPPHRRTAPLAPGAAHWLPLAPSALRRHGASAQPTHRACHSFLFLTLHPLVSIKFCAFISSAPIAQAQLSTVTKQTYQHNKQSIMLH